MYSHKHGRSRRARAGARRPHAHHAGQAARPARALQRGRRARVAVARRLGMDGEEIDEIARAAELHDVGKVGIPDAILDKPGRTRRHRVGAHAPAHDPRRADPQRRAGAAPGRAASCARRHERWDGTRLPRRAARRRDPARRAHRRGVRRLRGDDHRPRLPRRGAATRPPARSCATWPAPSSTRRSSPPSSPRSPSALPARRTRTAPRLRCRFSPIACARCSNRRS